MQTTTIMLPQRYFLLTFVAILALALPASAQRTWLTIQQEGARLVLEKGTTIQVSGKGHMQFGPQRWLVDVAGAEQAFVDGKQVRSERSVRARETVEIRGAAGIHWTLQLVSRPGMLASGTGTRITDEAPEDYARVDSETPLTFYIRIHPSGGTDFFYPDDAR